MTAGSPASQRWESRGSARPGGRGLGAGYLVGLGVGPFTGPVGAFDLGRSLALPTGALRFGGRIEARSIAWQDESVRTLRTLLTFSYEG